MVPLFVANRYDNLKHSTDKQSDYRHRTQSAQTQRVPVVTWQPSSKWDKGASSRSRPPPILMPESIRDLHRLRITAATTIKYPGAQAMHRIHHGNQIGTNTHSLPSGCRFSQLGLSLISRGTSSRAVQAFLCFHI